MRLCVSVTLLLVMTSVDCKKLSEARGRLQGLNMVKELHRNPSAYAFDMKCICPGANSNSTACNSPPPVSSCLAATKAFTWAVGVLYGSCFPPIEPNNTCHNLCMQLEIPFIPRQTDQMYLKDLEGDNEWANFIIGSTLASYPFPAAIGEAMSTISELLVLWEKLSSVYDDDDIGYSDMYYGIWRKAWEQRGDYLVNIAQDKEAKGNLVSAKNSYLKASMVYEVAQWPTPSLPESISVLNKSYNALFSALQYFPFHSEQVEIPYVTDTGDTIMLNGIFSSPDINKPLPLFILTSGLDWPLSAIYVQANFDLIERGYATLTYDGPGQGMVIRNPPYTPYTPNWDYVMNAVLDYTENNLANYVQLDNIIAESWSLGGYLGAQACTKMSHRLKGCAIIPGSYSFKNAIYEDMLFYALSPFQSVNASLVPPQYVDYIFNPLDTFQTMTECSAGMNIIQAWLNAAGQPYDTDTLYIAYKFGVNPSDENYLQTVGNLTKLYQYAAQGVKGLIPFEFPVEDTNNIQCPTFFTMGLQDGLMFGQTYQMYNASNANIRSSSPLVVYDGYSGSALHCSLGNFERLAGDIGDWAIQLLPPQNGQR